MQKMEEKEIVKETRSIMKESSTAAATVATVAVSNSTTARNEKEAILLQNRLTVFQTKRRNKVGKKTCKRESNCHPMYSLNYSLLIVL